jgi:hypothetical protein
VVDAFVDRITGRVQGPAVDGMVNYEASISVLKTAVPHSLPAALLVEVLAT